MMRSVEERGSDMDFRMDRKKSEVHYSVKSSDDLIDTPH